MTGTQLSFWDPYAPVPAVSHAIRQDAANGNGVADVDPLADLDVALADREAREELEAELAGAHLPQPCMCAGPIVVDEPADGPRCTKCGRNVRRFTARERLVVRLAFAATNGRST